MTIMLCFYSPTEPDIDVITFRSIPISGVDICGCINSWFAALFSSELDLLRQLCLFGHDFVHQFVAVVLLHPFVEEGSSQVIRPRVDISMNYVGHSRWSAQPPQGRKHTHSHRKKKRHCCAQCIPRYCRCRTATDQTRIQRQSAKYPNTGWFHLRPARDPDCS